MKDIEFAFRGHQRFVLMISIRVCPAKRRYTYLLEEIFHCFYSSSQRTKEDAFTSSDTPKTIIILMKNPEPCPHPQEAEGCARDVRSVINKRSAHCICIFEGDLLVEHRRES